MIGGPAYFGPQEIRSTVGYGDVLEPVAAALRDYSRGLGDAPAAVFVPAGPDGDVHVKSAWLPGRQVFTVKVASWFLERARRAGTPTSGVIAVFDATTGDLRALLDDEHHLSDIRTAAAGALAARMMARHDSRVLGVIGTGTQAYLQTLAVADELPLREVRVWGRRASHVQSLAAALHARRPDLRVIGVDSAQAAFDGADVVVTATSSTEPLVRASWLTPGVHINAVGADDPTKAELTSDSLRRADRIVVDSRELTAVHGDLSRLAEEDRRVDAELGEVLAGSAPGRDNDEEITICKLIGLGVQDLAAAEVALDMLGAPRRSTQIPAHAREVHRQAAEAGTPAVA